MNQFVVIYYPGGMSLNHSGYWLCERFTTRGGEVFDNKLKFLKKSY